MSNKLKSQKTYLTGAQIRHILRQVGVADRKLYRDIGANETWGKSLLSGELDGDIPKWIELVLTLYIVDAVSRESRGELELPLADYGLTLLTPLAEGADRPAQSDA